VKTKLAPFHVVYEALDLPPHSMSHLYGECLVGEDFAISQNKPWDLKVHFALPHTHSLGRRVFMQAMGGPADGKMIIDVGGNTGDPQGRAFDPPFDLTGSSGLRFGCDFENPRDEHVVYGIGDQEMCELLGFAETTLAFEGKVFDNRPDGTDGGKQIFTGHCSSIEFPYDQTRPGGPPK